jgi:hypothetical protein
MRTPWFLLAGSLVALAAVGVGGDARAQSPAPLPPKRPAVGHASSVEKDADAYCRWVRAIAESSSDVLVAPSVYATGGYVNGADVSLGAASVPATQRLIAAGLYSFGSLNRGLAMRAQADAECRRYRLDAELHAFIERNRDAASVRALTAKTKVLDEALPRAQEILTQEKAMMAQARATVDEVNGTQMRVETLRQLASEAHQQMDAMASAPPTPKTSIRQAVAARDDAEVETEKQDGRIRASYGWDLTLRGGYDRIFGIRDDTPLFAMATLTVNLGWFFQGGANADAESARKEWARAQIEGDDDRVEQVVARLRAVREAEIVRLRESTIVLADLEQRYKAVAGIGGDKARSYADYVWFDLIRVQAEHAYYAEHVHELDELLGGTDAPNAPNERVP